MKKKLLKTTLICFAILLGSSVLADEVVFQPRANPASAGFDAGQIDNTNLIQGKRYQAREKEYIETKDPAIIEEEVRQKMDLLNTEQVTFKLKAMADSVCNSIDQFGDFISG